MKNAWILEPWGLLTILMVHWLLDFIIQTDEQAKSKWHSNEALLSHTGIYAGGWFFAAVFMLMSGSTDAKGNTTDAYFIWYALVVAGITFVAHTVTDYITSRESHKYFAKMDTHNGFIIIGFDQILHYVQLYLTFKLLI